MSIFLGFLCGVCLTETVAMGPISPVPLEFIGVVWENTLDFSRDTLDPVVEDTEVPLDTDDKVDKVDLSDGIGELDMFLASSWSGDNGDTSFSFGI